MSGLLESKRIYDIPSDTDGTRILVDRLWPRGISKENAALDCWAKEIGPSTGLRKWYAHDPARFGQFCERYKAELNANPDATAFRNKIETLLQEGTVTLVFAAKDESHSNAAVLRDWLLN